MTARSPEDIDPTFEAAFNAKDGAALLSLYEAGAAFVLPTGDVIHGPAAIGEALGPFFAMDPTMNLKTEKILRARDLALVYSSWTVTGTAEDGSAVAMAGDSKIVVREQADGTWKFTLDDPGWKA